LIISIVEPLITTDNLSIKDDEYLGSCGVPVVAVQVILKKVARVLKSIKQLEGSLKVDMSLGPIEVVRSGVILVLIRENPPDNCLIAYDKDFGKPVGILIIF